LAPLAVAQLGRVARLLPLPAKFAVRDAARHRSRTAPAVAAVAATVAGVVALGIGGTSDAAQNRAMYTPTAPDGDGVVVAYGAERSSWPAFTAAVTHEVPDATVTTVRGLPESGSETYSLKDVAGGGTWTGALGSSYLVGAAGLPALRLPPDDERRARAALARGELVVLDPRSLHPRTVTLVAERYADDGSSTTLGSWRRRAVFVAASGMMQPAQVVLPTGLAAAAHLPVEPVGLVVSGTTIDQGAEDRLGEALAALDQNASLYVERGYHDDTTRVVLLILGLVGGTLVLGGTLTATFLALSDAKPDFATMGAVGAAPGTRRLVASSYAAGIGLLGAVLGAVVGFVPGIAVTFPLTSESWAEPGATTADGSPLPGHVLDVPWLLVGGLVLALPAVTALVVGLCSRSRLPMVSRLA
jgi:putative ABC transport system permease protein